MKCMAEECRIPCQTNLNSNTLTLSFVLQYELEKDLETLHVFKMRIFIELIVAGERVNCLRCMSRSKCSAL